MLRFVHLSFAFRTQMKTTELEPVITAIAEDWVRFSTSSWILWTDKPTPHIFSLLAPHLEPTDNALLSALGEDWFGYLPNWVWQWMAAKKPGEVAIGEQARGMMSLPAAVLRR